jgi:hemoglobin/transferrin/lactoferrin receptor protein
LLADPDLIKQVEIVRGPSSALYGGGGIGGVMAFRTIEADDILTPGDNFGGQIKTGYRSGNESRSATLIAAARSDGFDLLAGGTLRAAEDIRMGNGDDLLNDDELKTGLVKAGLNLNQNHRIEASYMKYADDLVTPANPGGNKDFGLQQLLERDQEQITGRYTFQDTNKKWFDGALTAYYTKLHFHAHPYDSRVSESEDETETVGLSLQNTTRLDTAPWLQHRITYGFDYYRDQLDNQSGNANNSVRPDGKQISYGGFIQDEMTLFDDWTLIGALRQDYYEIDPADGDSTKNDRLSPKVTLKWQAQPFLGLFASYAEAFRAPTMAETYQNLDTNVAFMNFRPNTDLKPETSRTKEVGFTLKFQDIVSQRDSFQLKGSYYWEDVDDMISSTVVGSFPRSAPFSDTGRIFQNQNISNAKRRGAEIEASYKTDQLDLRIGYSHLEAEDANTGEGLYAPPDKLTLGVRYLVDDHWSVWWSGQFVANQHDDAEVSRQRDGYSLHDIGLIYDGDWFRADLSVTNLFDKAYATYQQSLATAYTYEEGRSANLRLTIPF